MNYPEVTIKNLKVSSIPGRVDYPYQATVYLDGKKFCMVFERGDGGDLYFEPINGMDYSKTWGASFDREMERVNYQLKLYHPKTEFAGMELSATLDVVIARLVDNDIGWKDIQKITKKAILVALDGGLVRFDVSRGSIEDALKVFKEKNPEAIILNGMPREEAIKIWRENG
jgi:hypothetical protein